MPVSQLIFINGNSFDIPNNERSYKVPPQMAISNVYLVVNNGIGYGVGSLNVNETECGKLVTSHNFFNF